MKINKSLISKIIMGLVILLVLGFLFTRTIYAFDAAGIIDDFDNQHAANTENKVTQLIGSIVNIVSIVGAGVAIIMLVVIGIQYVSAAPEGKAEAKKDLTGYIIGAVILFATSGILKLLQVFIEGNFNN